MEFATSIGDEIDGRPLHLYRLSERLFDELEIGLRSGLGRSRDAETAAAFVLWAAEHYRRNFAGGSFSWAFLTDALGLSLDQAALRDLTARGLRKLRRPPPRSSDAGVQYLRTLSAEGGLPVRLLAHEGGYRAALVGLVADLERFGAGCPVEQALAFARRRAERLPMGYRTEEFHALFVQFARELVDLRGRAPRDLAAADVESWLDRTESAWRERLTLRFDGDAARALFAEAMAVRAGGVVEEPLGRQLVREEDGSWRAFVDVAPATRLPTRLIDGIDAAYRRVRLAPTGALAAACPDLMLALDREDGGWSTTRISGRRTARFPFPLSAPIQLVAIADGRLLQPVSLPSGGAVDPAQGLTLWTLAESSDDGAAAGMGRERVAADPRPIRLGARWRGRAGGAGAKLTAAASWRANLHWPYEPDAFGTAPTLEALLNPVLEEELAIISLSEIGPNDVAAWSVFIERFAAARSSGRAGPALLVTDIPVDLAVPVEAMPQNWQKALRRGDRVIWAEEHLSATREGLVGELAVVLAVELCAWRLDLAASLVQASLDDLADPIAWLSRRPEEPILGQETQCPIAILAGQRKSEIQQRVWKAQLTALFPEIESRRLEIVTAHRSRLRLDDHLRGLGVASIEEIELGALRFQLRGALTRQEADRLDVLVRTRNALAHRQPVPPEDALKLLRN